MPDFVTVQKFMDGNAAALAKSVLEGNGIQAWLSNENTTVMAPHYGFFSGGIRLQVMAEDDLRAREVLEGLESDLDLATDDADGPFETIMLLDTLAEARMLRGMLEARGFQATVEVPEDEAGDESNRGIMVNVPASEAAEVHALLDEIAAEGRGETLPPEAEMNIQDTVQDLEKVTPAADPIECPNCGSAQIHPNTTPRWIYILTVVVFLGLPLIFSSRHTRGCSNCDWEWTP